VLSLSLAFLAKLAARCQSAGSQPKPTISAEEAFANAEVSGAAPPSRPPSSPHCHCTAVAQLAMFRRNALLAAERGAWRARERSECVNPADCVSQPSDLNTRRDVRYCNRPSRSVRHSTRSPDARSEQRNSTRSRRSHGGRPAIRKQASRALRLTMRTPSVSVPMRRGHAFPDPLQSESRTFDGFPTFVSWTARNLGGFTSQDLPLVDPPRFLG